MMTAFADLALFPVDLPITQFAVVGTPSANPVTITAAKVATIAGLVGTNLLPALVVPVAAPVPIWQTVYQWSGATAAACRSHSRTGRRWRWCVMPPPLLPARPIQFPSHLHRILSLSVTGF